VLLGPLRALSYALVHGVVAATLGTCWRLKANFWLAVLAGGVMRVVGQLGYLALASLTMNDNVWGIMVSNVYNLLVRGRRQFSHHQDTSQLYVCRPLGPCTCGVQFMAAAAHLLAALQDQLCASMGLYSAPPPLLINGMVFALLTVNGLIYACLLQIIYRIILNVSAAGRERWRHHSTMCQPLS
jgi:hypothetical protein